MGVNLASPTRTETFISRSLAGYRASFSENLIQSPLAACASVITILTLRGAKGVEQGD